MLRVSCKHESDCPSAMLNLEANCETVGGGEEGKILYNITTALNLSSLFPGDKLVKDRVCSSFGEDVFILLFLYISSQYPFVKANLYWLSDIEALNTRSLNNMRYYMINIRYYIRKVLQITQGLHWNPKKEL